MERYIFTLMIVIPIKILFVRNQINVQWKYGH